jgi:hypothetical protein
MRVERSLLTISRKALSQQGVIVSEKQGKAPWYYLKETPKQAVEARMKVLGPLHVKTQEGMFTHRLGQTYEIAVMKAIKRSGLNFLGHFTDLGAHGDGTAYTKVDPMKRAQ